MSEFSIVGATLRAEQVDGRVVIHVEDIPSERQRLIDVAFFLGGLVVFCLHDADGPCPMKQGPRVTHGDAFVVPRPPESR